MGTRLLPTPMEEAGMAAHPGASAVRQGKGRLDCQLGRVGRSQAEDRAVQRSQPVQTHTVGHMYKYLVRIPWVVRSGARAHPSGRSLPQILRY